MPRFGEPLPASVAPLSPETDRLRVSVDRDRDFILPRTLERGRWSHVQWFRAGRSLAAITCLVASLSAAACSPAKPAPSSAPVSTPSAIDQIRADAQAISPFVSSELAKQFLAATASLPHVGSRTLYRTPDKKHVYTSTSAGALSDAERALLVPLEVDEELFYTTKYGSPLSYARALDLLQAHHVALAPPARIFDFGYGYVGHLRLLASLGFHTTGVDVDPLLAALYSTPGDQGQVAPFGNATGGSVQLLDGAFPADARITSTVGSGYALVMSKNVLKRGYIHPDRPADDKFLIHLGVTDEAFLHAVHDALAPHGTFLVYNICPALSPPDKPFVPWSDGRFPFPREALVAAGFDVLEFDRDDTPAIRQLGSALAWDKGEDAMDLEHDLSVLYTLATRRD